LTRAGASGTLLAFLRGQRGGPTRIGDVTSIVIILDCSGSMADKTQDGPSKMEVAKKVVSGLIEKIPNGRKVAFIIYGHDAELKCQAVEVVRPLSELDEAGKGRLKTALARLKPVGHTPIALSLRVAARELARDDGLCGVILITDGMETCHGDPNAEAARLAENPKLTFGLHVVGFDVDPKERQAVEAIARAGKGTYYEAKSPQKLTEAVEGLARKIVQADEPGIEDPLLKALVEDLKDKDGGVRRKAAEALGKMGPGRRRPCPT
jgi:Ca-activated chloride channel family protein